MIDSIDQDEIVRQLEHGHGDQAYGGIPHTMTRFLTPAMQAGNYPVGYDPAKARALLEEAGYRPGPDGIMQKDGKRLSFVYLEEAGTDAVQELDETLQQDFRSVGIEMKMQIIEFNQLLALMGGPPDGWEATGVGQPTQDYPSGESQYKTGSYQNQGGYSDPTMDKLIEANVDEPGMENLYAYETYLSAQQPVIFGPRERPVILVRNRPAWHDGFPQSKRDVRTGPALLHGERLMIRMIATRLASSTLSIVILVTLVFVMVHLTPGGPAYSILGQKATAASVAEINARLGLNVPIWQQYAVWWWHLAHGQLGYSYLLSRPVGALLWQYELNTLVFYSISITLSTLLSIVLGLIQGVYYGRWPARIIGAFQLGFYALPPFFVAAMLVLWFAVGLKILPANGIVDLREANPRHRQLCRPSGAAGDHHHLAHGMLAVALFRRGGA